MMLTAKRALRSLGLNRLAWFLIHKYAHIAPHHTCRRNGINYQLDLREVIDLAIYLRGGWEPETIRFLRDAVRSGDIVVEVGANVGAHTLILAGLVGAGGLVHAFEPAGYARRKLEMNIALNPTLASRILVHATLVTNHEHARPVCAIQSSYPTNGSRPKENVGTATVALDDVIDRADILKIDVDGYDYKVLQGAARLIERHRPLVFVELFERALAEQNDSIEDVFRFLRERGYRAEREDGRPLSGPAEVLALTPNGVSINGVFRP